MPITPRLRVHRFREGVRAAERQHIFLLLERETASGAYKLELVDQCGEFGNNASIIDPDDLVIIPVQY
jgi:hypothetical protein